MQITEHDIGNLPLREAPSVSKIGGLEFRNRDEAPCRTDQIAARRSNVTPVAAVLAFGHIEACHRHHGVNWLLGWGTVS